MVAWHGSHDLMRHPKPLENDMQFLKEPKDYAKELSPFLNIMSLDDIVERVARFPGAGPKYLNELRTALVLESGEATTIC